jgi:enoyl-CoA hydratase/carnithine racemase
MDTRVANTIGYEHIQVSAAAGIASITMNRSERRNALSEAHMRELIAALRAASDQPDMRAVILAANGSVCSGHDFADMINRDLDGMRQLLATCTDLMLTIRRLPQPVVAKVQGLATAAGCQLVASCDLAVAAEEASFATPGGKGGWFCHTPSVAVARSLGARAVGAKRALELAMVGDAIDARTALAWGFVNRVVPYAELDKATEALARAASRGSLASKALGKRPRGRLRACDGGDGRERAHARWARILPRLSREAAWRLPADALSGVKSA